MRCPVCGEETKVIDSRHKVEGVWRRRRECLSCFTRFTTFETIAYVEMDKYLLKAALKKQEESS